jgi:hypothetical protein
MCNLIINKNNFITNKKIQLKSVNCILSYQIYYNLYNHYKIIIFIFFYNKINTLG